MDLHVPAPSSSTESSGGAYNQSDGPAPPSGAHVPATSVQPQANGEVKGPDKARDEADAKTRTAKARTRRRRRAKRMYLPAWAFSLGVHVVVLGGLAAVTFTSDAGKRLLADINSALVPTGVKGEEELTPIYADPSTQVSNQAAGDIHAETVGGAGGAIGGVGSGNPSATPAISGAGSRVNEKTSLPGVKISPNVSGLSLLPATPGLDLGGSGLIAGDTTYEATDVGDSLDQIAREILRHLQQHRLTVVWLFDESESMKDDQKAIRERFDRVTHELKIHSETQTRSHKDKGGDPLNHVIVGFGQDIHYDLEKPTADIDRIGRAIDKLKVDASGVENTLHAINDVIEHYSGLIRKDRRLVIVLVTDESGDDGAFVEEAHQAIVSQRVPIYIIGRQSLFGYERAHLRYVDPVTKDVYWPPIRRGPETADVELLQWDGLHERRDEQPSGFAPYELARLTKDSGGIYFLLPSEENMRVRQREKAYKIAQLKEYIPDYKSRNQYAADRAKSEFRRTLYDVIQLTRNFSYRQNFPIDPEHLVPAVVEAGEIATERLNTLIAVQKRLESLKRFRDREPEKRWQAHYDLILAQIVAYQIKSFEYRACLEEIVKTSPKPKAIPGPELVVEWRIDHSHDRKAPKERTEKKYIEAKALLDAVIARHPNTPWADLAQDELNRGFGAQRFEDHHSPQYYGRMKLIPKY